MKTLLDSKSIAVVLTGTEKTKSLSKIARSIGWIELRIDKFLEVRAQDDPLKWVKKIRSITNSKVIGTIRWHKEREKKGIVIPENQRMQLYINILPFVDFVDVEIKSKIAFRVVNEAKRAGKKAIVSYHNFHRCPSERILIYLCKQAQKLGADIVKIAVMAKEENDLFTLISVLIKQGKKIPMVVIPMGSNFLQRLVPLAFGSQFTYAAFDKKTAPGQPLVSEIM